MENQETSYGDFMSEFDEGYQTGADMAESVSGGDGTPADDDAIVPGDDAGDDSTEPADDGGKPSEEPSDPPAQPAETPAQEQTFSLKINHEERVCSREEVISLAQKGADYDRGKEKLHSQQEAMDVLSALAKDAGTDIPGILETFRLNLLKKQGLSEDAAKERLLREQAEKKVAALEAERDAAKPEDNSQRAKRDLAEFRKHYPNVELTSELISKLTPAVQKGQSLTEAYRSFETTQKDARIAELEQQLAAERQNKENRASSPGSQKDTGGRRTKDDFNDFMEAFK